MANIYLIINNIEITSKSHLEEVIADLPEESKIALRNIYDSEEQAKSNE